MMKIEVLNNNFIELEDLIKVLNVKCELNSYNYENGILKGFLQFEGEYINSSSSFDEPFNFFKQVSFEIMFVENIGPIENVSIEDFEYFEVERRGIETETKLSITYVEERKVSKEDDIIIENFDENNEYDSIKENVESEIDNILTDALIDHIDIPKEETVFPTNSRRTKIKIQ